MPDPWLIQYLSKLIAQVDRANIGLQVSDTIADRLREGTNKYCLVKWQTVYPPPPPPEERERGDLYLRGMCRTCAHNEASSLSEGGMGRQGLCVLGRHWT